MMFPKLFLLLTLLLAGHASAAGLIVNAPKLGGSPVLDGKLDDRAWENASGSLVAFAPKSDALAEQRGSFRIGTHDGLLFLAFEIRTMPRMAAGRIVGRNGDISQDDSVDFYLSASGKSLRVAITAAGTLVTLLDGEASQFPCRAAATLIGTDDAVGGEVERGFIVEVEIPLQTLGLNPAETGATKVDFQVALRFKGIVQATWAPASDGAQVDAKSGGKLSFAGKAERIDGIQILPPERKVKLSGFFAQGGSYKIQPGDKVKALRSGAFAEDIAYPEAKFSITISGKIFSYTFAVDPGQVESITATAAPSRQEILIYGDSTAAAQQYGRQVRAAFLRGGQRLWEKTLNLGDPKSRLSEWVPYSDWGNGDVEFILEGVGNQGEARKTHTKLKLPEKPYWADFELPELDKVPDPFTPVQAGPDSVSVWGRTHTFGGGPFFDQVESNGEDLLAAPITLSGQVNGVPIEWKSATWELLQSTELLARYHGKVESKDGTLVLDIVAAVEFDGMAYFQARLQPSRTPMIDDLKLVIPFKKEQAKLFMRSGVEGYSWNDFSTWRLSGNIPDKPLPSKFSNWFWVGTQSRGLEWFAEHHLGWTPANPGEVITVVPGSESTDLVFDIIGNPRKLEAPLDIEFGLMASPIKKRRLNSDLPGFKVLAMADLPNPGDKAYEYPWIFMPLSPKMMDKDGCFEVDMRIDAFDPKNKQVSLMSHGRGDGFELDLVYLPEEKKIQITKVNTTRVDKQNPKKIDVIGEAMFSLEPGTWHRFQWNYGKQCELFIDGKPVIAADYVGGYPPFSFIYCYRSIGGYSAITLAGWRISDKPRKVNTAPPLSGFKADAETEHLENLRTDPTAMGYCDTEVGWLETPAYLRGKWTYNPEKHWLTGHKLAPQTWYEYYAKLGIRRLIPFNWAKGIIGHLGPHDSELFLKKIQAAKEVGIGVLPYAPEGIVDNAPYFSDNVREIVQGPPNEPLPLSWRESGTVNYRGTPSSQSRNKLALSAVDEYMRAGAEGSYWDGQSEPFLTGNPLTDRPERLDPATGKWVQTRPIRENRRFLWQIVTLMRKHHPNAMVFAHLGGFLLPTLGMVDITMNGENLGMFPDTWKEKIEPPVIQAEFSGRPFGLNTVAIMNSNFRVPPEWSAGLMNLHGTSCGAMWGMFPERAAPLWRLTEDFDCETADWLPYYDRKNLPFQPESPDVLASAFVHKGERALLFVANWSENEVSGKIRIDWEKLGLPPDTKVFDLNRNRAVPVQQATINIPLKPHAIRYIWIGPNPPQPYREVYDAMPEAK